jgi:hypothetical protein
MLSCSQLSMADVQEQSSSGSRQRMCASIHGREKRASPERAGPRPTGVHAIIWLRMIARAVNEATRPGRGKPGRDEAHRGSARCDRARRGATGRDEVHGVERSEVGAAARWYGKLTAVKRIITSVVEMPLKRVGSQKGM